MDRARNVGGDAMTEGTSTPAGWYPAPHAGNELRYWNGVDWTEHAAPAAPGSEQTPTSIGYPGAYPAAATSAVVRPLRGIAGATRILILVSAATSFLTVLVEAWGLNAIDGFSRGTAPLSALELYDTLSSFVALASAASLLAAGICWVVWQYRAAVRVRAANPMSTRRTPVWHVVSWFIPVIAFWFPFQNMKDLIVASRADVRATLLGWWWGLWIASTTFVTVSSRMSIAADSLPGYSAAMNVSLFAELLTIASAPLAVMVLTRTTNALEPAPR
ncbi:DUF4328 domain-containing protein [Microbacterium oleivorans]|nr:DUF4328 domain-containing protein [Microbacterium oleivorans]